MRTLERLTVESFVLFEMENTYSTQMSIDPKMGWFFEGLMTMSLDPKMGFGDDDDDKGFS